MLGFAVDAIVFPIVLMICCLNPSCQNPPCEPELISCSECGIELLVLENRYKPLKSIGRGGFGKTYLAEDIKKFGEHCVIKQFAPYAGNDTDSEKLRFRDEAKQLQRLGEHPQIPTLLAFFTERGYLYFVQQYIAGENLAEELDRRGLYDEARIRDFLQDLLGILQVVHQQGVIHRDLKPYNIMRRRADQKLVLIDFGISKQLEANPATGTSIGSLGYSPLEQFWGGKAYPSSDLYSLGVTAFYLLSGISPHQIVSQIMEEGSPAQAHNWVENWRDYVNQPVSDNLGAILDKLMQSDRKQRYQSAADALSDLTGQHQPLAPTTLSPAGAASGQEQPQLELTKQFSAPTAPSRWRNVKLYGGVGLGLIAASLTILLATRPSTTPSGDTSQDLGDRSENAVAYLERGKVRSAADNFKAALADFNRAIELQPTAEIYNERGQVRNKLQDRQGALADFDEALQLKPNWAEIYYQRASVREELGNLPQAHADLDKSIELQGDNTLAWIARGQLRLKQNNKPLALQDFNAAIQLDARSSYAYMSRAGLYASMNERVKAIADYDRAIVLDPSSYYQFYERGILHQELNHKAKAKADFAMTIQLAKKAGKEKDYEDATVRLQQLK
jgi:serine/threonine protein kinase